MQRSVVARVVEVVTSARVGSQLLVAGLLGGCALFGGGGRGAGLSLGENFAPNPMVVDVPLQSTQFDLQQGTSAYGYADCGSGVTTPAPATTMRLEAATDDLEVLLRGSDSVRKAVLVGPDGTKTCLEAGKAVTRASWPAGTYRYHPIKNPSGEPKLTQLVFTAVGRASSEASSRFAQQLKPGPELNPAYANASPKPGPVLRDAAVGIDQCVQAGTVFVTPVANLVAAHASVFRVQIASERPPQIYVRQADGTCVVHDRNKGASLPAGTHEIWLQVKRDASVPESFEVAVTDLQTPYALGEAPSHALENEPVTVLTTTRKPEMRAGPTCGQGQRAPSFYVRHARDEPPKTMLLHATEDATLRFFGPLEQQFDAGAGCRKKLSKAGTYAVWVDAPEGTDATVLVGDMKDVDPLATVREVPASPPLAQREYGRFYAYYGSGNRLPMEALFAAAPPQLFVFPSRPVKGLSAGEPVLVVDHGADQSVVVGLDNVHRTLATADLSPSPPKALSIPQPPLPKGPSEVHWYYAREKLAEIAGPVEGKLLDAYEQHRDTTYGCIRAYRKKNDPTWDKNYDLVNLKTGKTVASKVARAAERKCEFDKLTAKAKRLPAEVVAARKKAQADAIAQLRRKFK